MKKKNPTEKKEILLPWAIVVDTRERKPYSFEGITKRIQKRDVPIKIATISKGLKTGDYSISGMETRISIERKSPEDLISTVSRSRARFERELERLACMEFAAVVVELEWRSVQKLCGVLSAMSPASLDSSILAWNQRFPNVHFYFRPSRFVAQKTVYKILHRFYEDALQRNNKD